MPITSEEEASDRDMPELAPICPPPIRKSQGDDQEPDLGTKLSPLGSTSSIQDLIESNSAGEAVSESQNTFTWTTLERQKMAKESGTEFLMPEETADGKQSLSACEDNSEDAEEHVTSYLEQPPLKVLEKKFTEEDEDANEMSRKSSSSGSYSVTSALAGNKIEKGSTDILVVEGQMLEHATDVLALQEGQTFEHPFLEGQSFELATDILVVKSQRPSFELAADLGQTSTAMSSFEQTTGSVEGYVSSFEQEVVLEESNISTFESPQTPPEFVESEKSKRKEISEKESEVVVVTKPAEVEPECKPTPATIRKQELTLDLQKEAASLPFKSPQDITSSFSPDDSGSENSMMWQRLPMGTGDVQKKRQAFERQIRCLSEDTKPKILNGKVKTPSSGGVRKIVSEERAGGSPMGAGGLARSPAMHSGFRTEDWVVERTPVNTPVNDRVLVGMINLSDEENSFRGSSEDLCKSSGATTPQGSINSSSFAPSTLDLTKTETEKTFPDSKMQFSQESQEMTSQEESVHVQTEEEDVIEQSKPEEEVVQIPEKPEFTATGKAEEKPICKNGDQPVVPLMAPPAGFGDSPEHVPHKRLPGFHEPLADQVLPQEELLIAEDFAPPAIATLHIAETFQTPDNGAAGRSESHQTTVASAAVTADFRVVEAAPVEPTSLERQTKRKMSASSVVSRTSGHSSHRSRSRSRSKERLLSKLAHSGDVNITSDEEDDIAGLIF